MFSLSVFVYVPVVILVPGSLTGGGKSRQRGARWQLGLSSNRPESRGYSIIESRNRSKLVTVNRRSLVAGSVDTEGDCSSLILFSFLFFLTILFFFLEPRWRCFLKPSFARPLRSIVAQSRFYSSAVIWALSPGPEQKWVFIWLLVSIRSHELCVISYVTR